MKDDKSHKLLEALDRDRDLKTLENRLKKQVNFFDILQISEMEIRHSNMLAWLLDANQSHGLKDYIISDFYSAITGKRGNKSLFGSFEIYREWKNIDLLLVSKAYGVIICIENKINAGESRNQLGKYHKIVEKEFPAKDFRHYYCFLTIDGHESSQPEIWRSMSYEIIMDSLRRALTEFEFSLNIQAKTILEQYLIILERKIIGMDAETKALVDSIYQKHQAALRLIMDNIDSSLTGKTSEAIMKWLKKNLPANMHIDPEKSGKSYIRIHSDKLDSLFPRNKKRTNWGNGSKYYYEVSSAADGAATVKLVFALETLDTEKERELVDKLFNSKEAHTRNTGTQWCTVKSFVPRSQMMDPNDYSLVGEELLAKAFQQKIPAFEAGL